MDPKHHKPITLGQFLKLMAIAPTGGQAKLAIQAGEVAVNGVVETRRGRKLQAGDLVAVAGRVYEVVVEAAIEEQQHEL